MMANLAYFYIYPVMRALQTIPTQKVHHGCRLFYIPGD